MMTAATLMDFGVLPELSKVADFEAIEVGQLGPTRCG